MVTDGQKIVMWANRLRCGKKPPICVQCGAEVRMPSDYEGELWFCNWRCMSVFQRPTEIREPGCDDE